MTKKIITIFEENEVIQKVLWMFNRSFFCCKIQTSKKKTFSEKWCQRDDKVRKQAFMLTKCRQIVRLSFKKLLKLFLLNRTRYWTWSPAWYGTSGNQM